MITYIKQNFYEVYTINLRHVYIYMVFSGTNKTDFFPSNSSQMGRVCWRYMLLGTEVESGGIQSLEHTDSS